MLDSGRVALALAFVIGAVSVTLLFQTLSFVGLVFVVAGGGLSLLSVRHSEDLSSPPSPRPNWAALGGDERSSEWRTESNERPPPATTNTRPTSERA
jgi:hypothetical protein